MVVQPAVREQEIRKGPEEIHEIKFGENSVTMDSALRWMRRACQFFGLPKTGSKGQCWERLTRHMANAELDAALEVARRYQEDMVRHGIPVPMPKEVSAEEMERHQLTHLPKADWCESCTATKSREDAHKSLVNKGDDSRTIMHMDLGYLTGEAKPGEKAPSTAFLCAVGSQTTWVTAIPVPSKDRFGLKYVVQQLVNATAGMGDVRLLIRTDQEPALKQIARTWPSSRAGLKL